MIFTPAMLKNYSFLVVVTFTLLTLFAISLYSLGEKADRKTSVLITESPYPFDVTVSNVKHAIKSNNFRLIRQYQANSNEHTLYFCNFNTAYQAILLDVNAGALLPCRIKVIQSNSIVLITTLDVDAAQKGIGLNKVGSLCKKMKHSIKRIIAEATL